MYQTAYGFSTMSIDHARAEFEKDADRLERAGYEELSVVIETSGPGPDGRIEYHVEQQYVKVV